MMPDKRRTSTAEFKREAVHLVTEQGYALAEAARNLGLNPPYAPALETGTGGGERRPPFQATVVSRPRRKNSTDCRKKTRACAWSATF